MLIRKRLAKEKCREIDAFKKKFVTALLCTFVLVCQSGKLAPKIAVDTRLAVTYTDTHSKHWFSTEE